jgi:hypothetical protein
MTNTPSPPQSPRSALSAEALLRLASEIRSINGITKPDADRIDYWANRVEQFAAEIAALNPPSGSALPQGGAVALPIDYDKDYDRYYIPLPGGWEVQTKGRGSSFRIANTKANERLNIPPSPYLYELLERMAREIHAAVNTQQPSAPEGSSASGDAKHHAAVVAAL